MPTSTQLPLESLFTIGPPESPWQVSVPPMEVLSPVPLTQCAAVSTTCGSTMAPPQPMDSRTTQGNSPLAACVPPTTYGPIGSPRPRTVGVGSAAAVLTTSPAATVPA